MKHDLRTRVAMALLSLGEDQECDGEFGLIVPACRNEDHSGDCTKQPWTCNRCICDEYLSKADKLIEHFGIVEK